MSASSRILLSLLIFFCPLHAKAGRMIASLGAATDTAAVKTVSATALMAVQTATDTAAVKTVSATALMAAQAATDTAAIKTVSATALMAAQTVTDTAAIKTVSATALMAAQAAVDSQSDTVAPPKKKDNIFKAFIRQLIGGNKDRTFEKPIDFSFAISPSYTREASFGIGGMVTGLYRIDRTDSIMQPSDVSLFANASLSGFYNFMLKGNNNFRHNTSRLSYDVTFSNKPLDFWGISYDACASDAMIKYTRRQLKFNADYIYRLTNAFYLGAALNLNYSFISSIDDISYLQGQRDSYFVTGLGLSLQYDTRDFILNARRGIYFMLKEVVYPAPLGNAGKSVFSTTLIFNYYVQLWKNSVLAFDLYGQYNGTDVPWPLRAELGAGGSRMRGYYAGRYIDNNQVNVQVELRQRIYGRLGAVVWGGCGTVFPSFSGFRWSHLLFNYGLGLRFEFKHNVNLRVDYGFGKHTGGFFFGVAEAF